MKKLLTLSLALLVINVWSQCSNTVSPASQSVTCSGGGTSVSFTATALSPSVNIRHEWYSPMSPLPGGFPIYTSTNAVSVLSGSFSPGVYTVVTTDLGTLCQSFSTFTITSPDAYPSFSVASTTNYSVGCVPQTTLMIVNPISTQTPPATVSYTFLPPGFTGTVFNGPLSGNGSTITSQVGTWTVLVNDNSNSCKGFLPVPIYLSSSSPSFTHSVGAAGLVFFQSTSSGTNAGTSYSWDFGDGATGTGSNPSHTYSNGGIHKVILNTSNPACNTPTIPVNVTSIPCTANSGYSVAYSGTPQVWYAAPNYYGNVINVIWNWGDGSSDNTMFPVHTYSAAGLYNICLSVTVSCASTSSFCSSYNIFRMAGLSQAMSTVVVVPKLPETIGIKEISKVENAINLFPVPAGDYLNIDFQTKGMETKFTKAEIINSVGEVVKQSELPITDNNASMDVREIPVGVYLLRIYGQRQTVIKRIIIVR